MPATSIGTPHALPRLGVSMNSRVSIPSLVFVVAVLSTFGLCQEQASGQLSFIVQKMEHVQSMGPCCAYEVIRKYQLFSAKDSHPIAEVTAALDYRPPNQKTYVVQKSSGSGRGEEVALKPAAFAVA